MPHQNPKLEILYPKPKHAGQADPRAFALVGSNSKWPCPFRMGLGAETSVVGKF